VASTIAVLVLFELGVSVWYGTLGSPGPFELVEEYRSPFVFRLRAGVAGNNLGLRRAVDTPTVAAPGTRRILSYGDSIAEGYRLEGAATYADLLESALETAGGESFEVLNMVRGHSPTVYSFHVRIDVPRLRPDGVILQIELINDVSDEARARTRGRDADGLPLEILAHRYLVGWDGHLLAPLAFSGSFIERTKLYAKLSRWLGRASERLRPNPIFAAESPITFYSRRSDRFLLTEAALDAGFERLFDSVAGIQRYLERQGVRFLLIILPSRHVYAHGQYAGSSRALLLRGEEAARARDIRYVSLDAALGRAGGADLFMDFCHPTAAGNRVIASELEPILRAW
jgi:hypothetical protein